MNSLKLTAVIAALGLSTLASAQSAVNTTASQGGFYVGLEGNYLNPTNDRLGYATLFNPNDATASEKKLEPGYALGFGIILGYSFPNSEKGVEFRYNRLKTDKEERLTNIQGYINSSASDEIGEFVKQNLERVGFKPVDPYARNPFITENMQAKMDVTLDDAAVLLGQHISFNQFSTRVYAGVGYANLKEEIKVAANSRGYFTYNSLIVPVDNKLSERYTSRFQGLGPLVGLVGNYNLFTNFNLVANLEASLLIGETKAGAIGHVQTFINDEKIFEMPGIIPEKGANRIVPKLATSLGLQYSHALNNNYRLTVEAGYKAAAYLNAKDKITVTELELRNMRYSRSSSNYLFAGPYLQLKLLAS